MAAALLYRIENDEIRRTLDGAPLTLGAAATNDIVIEAAAVADRHARVEPTGEGWRVVDLGSHAGTTVNGERVDGRLLRHDDCMALGEFELRFVDAPDVSDVATDGSAAPPQLVQAAAEFSTLCAMPSEPRLKQLLSILNRSAEIIVTTYHLDDLYRKILDLMFEHLPVQRAMVVRWDRSQNRFTVACARRKPSRGATDDLRFSRTIAERVCKERVAILTLDAQTDARFEWGSSIRAIGIRSAIAAPIWRGEGVEGLLYADTLKSVRSFDQFDLDLLSALGNHLAVALERTRLEEAIIQEKLVRVRLERYHSPSVISHIVSQGAGSLDELLGEAREVTVLFSDLVDFTARCERLEPEEVTRFLNRYFGRMTEIVFHLEGTLDKYIGDGLMAVFGAPRPDSDHARRAVDAALAMREALGELNRDAPPGARLTFRVGIHSGRVVAGDVGAVSRRDYTVLGRTVNLASRLESLVAAPGQIVVSEATRRMLGDHYDLRPIGTHQPKGIARPVECFELVGRNPSARG